MGAASTEPLLQSTDSRGDPMSDDLISRDIALRIGLAARTLPDTDPARLLRVLADAVGLPPTKAKLAKLKVKDLKAAADGEFADMDASVLKDALAALKGESEADAEPLPEPDAYSEGDMPDSIRVACASNKAEALDGHFGSCSRFLIYQVSPEETRLIDVRRIDDSDAEDKNAYRASLIADCQVIYVMSVGGPAAAKIVRAGVHPIKVPDGGPARAKAAELQAVLGKAPPPWLAKVMGKTPEERVRFELEAEA